MDTIEILEKVKTGEVSIKEAEAFFRKVPISDMEFAKLDLHRQIRSGFTEVVFCQGKAEEHLVLIFDKLYKEYHTVMGTRATKEQYQIIKKNFPEAEYDPISKIIKIGNGELEKKGLVAVCSAGTADIPVAEEAAQVAEYFGCKVDRIYDIGVCGIHRVISNAERIQKANCVIAVAGMEGALASVLAGLVDKPVIGVPTSVGYGANFGGVSALLTMINSCANGIATVNIDNGYGAGYLATQINRMGVRNE